MMYLIFICHALSATASDKSYKSVSIIKINSLVIVANFLESQNTARCFYANCPKRILL